MAQQTEPNDHIRHEQRKRGALIVAACVFVILASLYLLIDVRLQGWGQPFHDVKVEDSAWLQWLFAGLTGTALSQLWLAAIGFEKVKVLDPVLSSYIAKLREMALRGNATGLDAEQNLMLARPEDLVADPVMEKDNFIEKTPTFILNFLRGPIVVLIVLFTLTNVTLAASLIPQDTEPTTAEVSSATAEEEPVSGGEETQGTAPDETTDSSSSAGDTSDSAADLKGIPLGIAIDLRTAEPNVLVILAFVLGYYQKLATTVVDNIARKIFGDKVWEQAYSKDTATGATNGDEDSASGAKNSGDTPKPKDEE